ncbi:hypothetical protein I552_3614 [Mycobacterium xenopi 3993]|nr:hypothetical protein I552_3614 [Mycobacterium xenopi 3993]
MGAAAARRWRTNPEEARLLDEAELAERAKRAQSALGEGGSIDGAAAPQGGSR